MHAIVQERQLRYFTMFSWAEYAPTAERTHDAAINVCKVPIIYLDQVGQHVLHSCTHSPCNRR